MVWFTSQGTELLFIVGAVSRTTVSSKSSESVTESCTWLSCIWYIGLGGHVNSRSSYCRLSTEHTQLLEKALEERRDEIEAIKEQHLLQLTETEEQLKQQNQKIVSHLIKLY